MKFFLDSADQHIIQQWLPTNLVDGITTNPTNLSAMGKNPTNTITHLCTILGTREINIEVTKKEPKELYTQAKKIADIAPNVIVKIPCHMAYTETIARLVRENCRINITLIFTLLQGMLMSKLGVHYLSPFIGRLEDSGKDGLLLVQELVHMVNHYQFNTQILAASVRTQEQLTGIINAGAHAATIPPNLFENLATHPLTTKGIAQFETDWAHIGTDIFP